MKIKCINCNVIVKLQIIDSLSSGTYYIVECPVCGKKDKLKGWWDGWNIFDMNYKKTQFTHVKKCKK